MLSSSPPQYPSSITHIISHLVIQSAAKDLKNKQLNNTMTNRSLETQDDMKSKLFNFVNLNVHLQRRLTKFAAYQVPPKPVFYGFCK